MNNLNILIVEGNIREDSEFFIKAAGASAADNLKNLILKLEPSTNTEIINPGFGVRDGINIFLAGYIGPENIRFREVELNFKIAETANSKSWAYQFNFFKNKSSVISIDAPGFGKSDPSSIDMDVIVQ